MFHFNFDVNGAVDDLPIGDSSAVPSADKVIYDTISAPQETFSEIDFESLLEALPTQLSYSFISLPSSNGHPDLKLARRDLFDARFQLISEGTGDPDYFTGEPPDGSDPSSAASALQFIDNPSDLIPLVYEGGLKTWECSLDLASCLRCDGHAADVKGRRVLEVGCGTAIPTICILREIFASPPTGNAETHVHLQDYNASVLKLVTMPNIILAWCEWPDDAQACANVSYTTTFLPIVNARVLDTSQAADAYKSSELHASEDSDSEVHLTPQLLQAFKATIQTYRLHLRFFSGAWHAFDLARIGGAPYHLVLTAETIYHPRALQSLVRLLRDACASGEETGVCLVAAKTVYFGVGGGIVEFVRAVEAVAGAMPVETIWEISTGVSRKVMRVRWS